MWWRRWRHGPNKWCLNDSKDKSVPKYGGNKINFMICSEVMQRCCNSKIHGIDDAFSQPANSTFRSRRRILSATTSWAVSGRGIPMISTICHKRGNVVLDHGGLFEIPGNKGFEVWCQFHAVNDPPMEINTSELQGAVFGFATTSRTGKTFRITQDRV